MLLSCSIADEGDLEVGDVITIKYVSWRTGESGDEHVVKWVPAEIIFRESGTWPVARLADGQFTELRPYMTWRHVAKARARSLAA